MSQEIRTQILSQLQEFGLNPNDWSLRARSDSSKCHLIHRQDPKIRLLGHLFSGRLQDLILIT